MANRLGSDPTGNIDLLARESLASAKYGDRDRLSRVAGCFGARLCTAGTKMAGHLLAAGIERIVDEAEVASLLPGGEAGEETAGGAARVRKGG